MRCFLREIEDRDKEELLKMVDEIKNDVLPDSFEGFRNIKDLTLYNYNQFLKDLDRNKHIQMYKPNLVDQTSYILVDEMGHIYGGTNIRHELNEALYIHGGHIGYLIRPSERMKGYGSFLLKLALEKCREIHIDTVLVTCREDNIGSAKVIENNGGVYENSMLCEENNLMFRRYWFSLK